VLTCFPLDACGLCRSHVLKNVAVEEAAKKMIVLTAMRCCMTRRRAGGLPKPLVVSAAVDRGCNAVEDRCEAVKKQAVCIEAVCVYV